MHLALNPARRRWLAWAVTGTAVALTHAQNQAPGARIVSVGGALTETIFALGAQADLVGVDTTSLFPPQAQRLPNVGYARALSAEGVLSLRPSLILASADAGPPAVLRQLEAARIPIERIDIGHSVEGMLAMVRRVGALTQRAADAQALAQRLDADVQRARARALELRGARRPLRVLFVLAHAPNALRIAGRGTAAHAMIELAGASNVLAELEGYKPLTPEAAIAAEPDVILCTDQGLSAAGGIDGLLRAPGLAVTPAGRSRRVVALEALLLLGFGPRLAQAISQLAEAMYAAPASAPRA